MAVRNVPRNFKKDRYDQSDLTDHERVELYAEWLEHEDAAVRANALICLIHQTNLSAGSADPGIGRTVCYRGWL